MTYGATRAAPTIGPPSTAVVGYSYGDGLPSEWLDPSTPSKDAVKHTRHRTESLELFKK